jgi:hypothetical protein
MNIYIFFNKNIFLAGHQWLTPVILDAQEREIRRIMVQACLGHKVRPPFQKQPMQKG